MLLVIGHTKENNYDGYDPHHHVMLVDITLREYKQFHKETGKVFPDASLVTQILNPWRCPQVKKHMELAPGGYDYRDYVEPQHHNLYATPGQHDGTDVTPFPFDNLGLKEAGRFKTAYININGLHSTCVVFRISKIATAPKYSLMQGSWVRIDNTTRQDIVLNETFVTAKEWQSMRPGYWPVIRNFEEIMKIFGLNLRLSELEAITRELAKYLRQEAKYNQAMRDYNTENEVAQLQLAYDQGYQNALRQMLMMGDSALQIAQATIDSIDQQKPLKKENSASSDSTEGKDDRGVNNLSCQDKDGEIAARNGTSESLSTKESNATNNLSIDLSSLKNLQSTSTKTAKEGGSTSDLKANLTIAKNKKPAGTIAQQAIKEIRRTGKVYTVEYHQD